MNRQSKQKNLVRKQSFGFGLLILTFLTAGTFFLNFEVHQQQQFKGSAQTTNCNVASNKLSMSASEKELLKLINDYRQQNGAGPLAPQAQLQQAAAWLSNHMATGGPFDHTDGLGRSPEQRLPDCGYTSRTFGENIALNQGSGDSAAMTFDQWKNSPPHNTNMLNPKYTQVGLSESVSSDGKHLWTYDAGTGGSNVAPPAGGGSNTDTPSQDLSPTEIPSNPPQDTQPSSLPQDTQLPTPTFSPLGGDQPAPTDPVDQIDNPGGGNPGGGNPGTGTTNPGLGGGTNVPTDQNLLVLIITIIITLLQSIFGN